MATPIKRGKPTGPALVRPDHEDDIDIDDPEGFQEITDGLPR